MKLDEYSRVRIEFVDGRVFEGVVLPNTVLKLDDGYNIGFSKKDVKEVTVLAKKSTRSSSVSAPSINSSLPRVDILHTGGTIASKVDYATGGVSNLFAPEELLALYPELQGVAATRASFVANMSSDDMRFDHYNLLVEAVKDALTSKPSGIVITHGTDTLHYTAAALHYALQGVTVPVVLVGSQRSSDRGSSDAASNLLAAIRFCTHKDSPSGVFVAMHESSSDESVAIHQGVFTRKMHTSRRDAFKTINASLVAKVRKEEVSVLRKLDSASTFSPVLFDTRLRIGMLYAHPHMYAQEVSSYKGFDGLIVLGTGLGHLPISVTDEYTQEHEKIFSSLNKLSCPVIMASQCVHGRINLQVYSPGRRLQEAGVLGHDLALSAEALFCKLAYLLSTKQDASLIASDMGDVVLCTREDSYE
ncbi:MAG: Glu-tRNA(Gln) amidotransferase subunit GatD [Candidatus Woesearchaeota archaeon]